MPAFSTPMFSRYRWICPEPGGRSGLDRGDDSANERVEGSIVPREKISSPPHAWHGWQGGPAGTFFLWRKRLLPRRFTRLGIVPSRLSDDEGSYPGRRPCSAHWLLLGCNAADEARCDAGANAISSTGTDEKVEGDFRYPSEIQ